MPVVTTDNAPPAVLTPERVVGGKLGGKPGDVCTVPIVRALLSSRNEKPPAAALPVARPANVVTTLAPFSATGFTRHGQTAGNDAATRLQDRPLEFNTTVAPVKLASSAKSAPKPVVVSVRAPARH